jgi:hypothetical protein
MSVIYPVSLINTRLQDVVTAIGAGGSPGVLRLLNSAGTTLSSLQLAQPCGSVAAGVLTFGGMSLIDPAAAASGTAAGARIEDSSGNTIISGLTVGTSSAFDIVLSPTAAIVAGNTIAITQGTITGH